MKFMKILLTLVLLTVVGGCNESSNNESNIDYDNPNLTGGLMVFPDKLVFTDNASKQFSFTYDSRSIVPVGVDTTNVSEIYNVTYDVGACMAANAFNQMCSVTVQYKDPAYVCADTQLKGFLLKFRYVVDFGVGLAKDHLLAVQCQKS